MRFRFWLFVARTCRRLMVWAAGRAMKADPSVIVLSRLSDVAVHLRREAERQQREGRAN